MVSDGCASCFAHGRCPGPQGRARVLYLWRSNRMFCSSCGAMLSLLLWYISTPSSMRACLTASLRALAVRSLVLRAARFRACYFFRSASGGGFPSVSPRSVRYSVVYRLYALWPLALAKACLSCGFVQQAVRQGGSAGAVNSYARTSASHGGTVANYLR